MIAGFFVSIKHHFMHPIATKKTQIRCVPKWKNATHRIAHN
jgi:hypothetical protein